MRLIFFLLPVTLALSTGCKTAGYYAQAVQGQFEMLSKRRSIETVIADPKTPEMVRRKLELLFELRTFAASELSLPVDGSYLHYADLQRRFAVWNLHAAPELSIEPKNWFYPFIGSLSYRGYFSYEAAFRYGRKLSRQGYDVHLDGVETYSTLGWFRDPVLNTFIHHSPPALAEILFHELAHQKLFINGDTDFNEAFATAVAQEGVRRWLRRRGDSEGLKRFELSVRREAQFVELIMAARKELDELYKNALASTESKRAGKQQILDQLRSRYQSLRQSWNGYSGYDAWFSFPLNNAQLNSISTYYDLVPSFQALLDSEGNNLTRFYDAVERMRREPKQERHETLRALLKENLTRETSENP